MPGPLVVHVNRDDHHTLDPAVREFEASGPFVLQLRNHGAGCHLHLTFHGDIAPGPGLDDDNPYLAEGDVLEVPVRVLGDLRPARGSVEVVTGYGQASTTVEVAVTDGGSRRDATGPTTAEPVPGTAGASPADAAPAPAPDDPTRSAILLPALAALRELAPERTAATAVLAVLALLAVLAAWLAVRLLDGTAVTVGVVAVVATVLGAAIYLLTQ